MKYASISFAVVALITGLVAAGYWFVSGMAKFGPVGPNWGLPETGAPTEPILLEQKVLANSVANMQDTQAVIDGIKKSSDLNRTAALWTAASVAASALSAILGALA